MYEVSSKGDRRFSALYARLQDGRTIEEAYQLDVKGYRRKGNDWRLGKGKPPLIPMSKEQYYVEYLRIWLLWARENRPLMRELNAKRIQFGGLVDSFARTPINQARALTDILTGDWRNYILEECMPVPRTYP